MKNSVRIVAVAVIALLLVSTIVVVFETNLLGTKNVGSTTTSSTGSTTSSASAVQQLMPITKVQSGLVASDALVSPQTQQQLLSNQTYWAYGGTADVQSSYYSVAVTTNELEIGVTSPTQGQWLGYYAVSPPTNATLASALLTAPSNSVPGRYSVGLYVQSTNQILNYVGCVAATSPQGTEWEVVHDLATNSTNGSIVPLWGVSNSGQKLTQDCTIITNGTNYLKVYLNHVVVYQSSTLQLGMQAPYNFYLESESSTTGGLIYGGYQNFYAAQSEDVKIVNAPSNALTAAVVGSNGSVLATAPVTSGTANVVLGQYAFPQAASVRLYNSSTNISNSSLIASSPSHASVSGGDVFTFGSGTASSKSSTLSINAQDTSGNNLSGISAAITQNRATIASGYMPVAFPLNNSQSYSVTASDFGMYTFDHWSDGSTLRTITVSVTSNTQLTAVYRIASAPAPSGMTLLSITEVSSNGNPLSGFGVSVWQDGSLVATSFSPNTFLLKDGVQYQVSVSSFGSYTFAQWSDGVTTATRSVTGISTTPTINLVAVYSDNGQS
jgi:hypothetical protein